MSKGSLLGGAIVIGILFAACSPDNDDTTPTPAAAPSTSTVSSTPSYSQTRTDSTIARPVAAEPAFAGQPITVSQVIDGDTFTTSDGRTIRVLGIDSCEKGTYGGDQAKLAAEGQLRNSSNTPITVIAEPGVDTDKDGRQLRYVQLGNQHLDFGEFMVKYDHTGVYQGRNDASPEYVARLYSLDTEYAMKPPSGRECGDPYPSTTGTDENSYSYDGDDGDYNMPDGALTGGYCARKWWC